MTCTWSRCLLSASYSDSELGVNLLYIIFASSFLYMLTSIAFRSFAASKSLCLPVLSSGLPSLLPHRSRAYLSTHALRSFHSSSARLNKALPNQSCPSCSRPLLSPLPACTNCGHISGLPQDVKYHDIFALPYEPNPFVIDIAVLKQRFREAQSICHPDSWASKGSVRGIPLFSIDRAHILPRTNKTSPRLFLLGSTRPIKAS